MFMPTAMHEVRRNDIYRFQCYKSICLDHIKGVAIFTEPSRTPDCKRPISHELGWYRTFPEFHEFRAPMCCQIVGALMSQHGEFMTSIEHCSCHLVIHAALPIPETEKVRDDGDLQSLTPVTEFVQAGLQPLSITT